MATEISRRRRPLCRPHEIGGLELTEPWENGLDRVLQIVLVLCA